MKTLNDTDKWTKTMPMIVELISGGHGGEVSWRWARDELMRLALHTDENNLDHPGIHVPVPAWLLGHSTYLEFQSLSTALNDALREGHNYIGHVLPSGKTIAEVVERMWEITNETQHISKKRAEGA